MHIFANKICFELNVYIEKSNMFACAFGERVEKVSNHNSRKRCPLQLTQQKNNGIAKRSTENN